jgi:hypothetical protein
MSQPQASSTVSFLPFFQLFLLLHSSSTHIFFPSSFLLLVYPHYLPCYISSPSPLDSSLSSSLFLDFSFPGIESNFNYWGRTAQFRPLRARPFTLESQMVTVFDGKDDKKQLMRFLELYLQAFHSVRGRSTLFLSILFTVLCPSSSSFFLLLLPLLSSVFFLFLLLSDSPSSSSFVRRPFLLNMGWRVGYWTKPNKG